MVKHPEELGFKLGLKVHIGQPARIMWADRAASTTRDVVYVALLDDSRRLNKGDALKVGQAGSLKRRWQGIVAIFEPHRKLRDNEKSDRSKLLEFANGKEISVWMKEAGKTEIPYAKGLTKTNAFSTRCAEEEFLDQYYEPKFGKPLNRERTTETD